MIQVKGVIANGENSQLNWISTQLNTKWNDFKLQL